ncbi:MAG: hypothetical protein M3Q58_04595 [Bacteroidota bacterium]|nr:hypothetical protein [Bacteroidota bacterium]
MKYLMGLMALILITSCQEKIPDAFFQVSEEDYIPGNEIVIKNLSVQGYSYQWEISKINYQEKFITEDLKFTPLGNARYTISLTAYSKNKTKKDVFERAINVNIGQGNVVFYTNEDSDCYRIYIDITPNGHSGTITYKSATTPSCSNSSSSSYVANLDVGDYTYNAYHAANYYNFYDCESWSGNFSITKNGCLPILLFQ